MKRKRKNGTPPKKDEKYQESTGRHIVVIGYNNDTISDITILDIDNEFFKNLNKSLFN